MHDMWLRNWRAGKTQSITCYDLSSAFDTLNIDIFTSKLKIYGFCEKSRRWFSSYLSERKKVVLVGASLSKPVTTSVGSPQGAVLSPTCFLILIADIGLWSKSEIFGYADDTSSTLAHSDVEVLLKSCEEEAQKMLDFMSINRLKANDDKTGIVIIRKNKSDDTLTIKIGSEDIVEKNSQKLLGITVDKNLKWESHIKNLVRKLNFRLFTLRRIKEKIPNSLLKSVAEAIFMSHIRYALPLYCPVQIDEDCPISGSITDLKKVFNDCLRLLEGKVISDQVSIKSMLDDLGLLSVNQLAAETRLLEAWKTVHQEDYCMKDILKLRHKGSYNTRSSNVDFLDTGVDDVYGSAGFVNTTAKLWNKSPNSVKDVPTLCIAKREIRNFVKEKIPI